jgi:hypothetical protein
MLKRFNLTIQAAPSPAQPVAALSIKDHKRFRELDLLIDNGFGNISQEKIPGEVLEAIEEGLPIPFRGPDKDTKFAHPVDDPVQRKRKPEPKRVLDEEKIQRRRDRARARYVYLYGPRLGARKKKAE